jgi:type II secretory pathway component PulJ
MRAARQAFTLFELILAIALSATLMLLIGAAINLYLLQVDAARTRIEEGQLARSILSMIAADIRAANVYQTQDTSGVAQLAASSADVVAGIDDAGTFNPSAFSTGAGVGSSAESSADESSSTLAPGLNGTLQELIVDVSRLPRFDELFPATQQQPGATTAAAVNVPRPSDLKTVRYFLRQGDTLEASDAATTSLAPDAQLQVGGLVRQTIDRAVRDLAEQSGNTAVLNGGQVLVAPEVVHIEFRYFDGAAAVEAWDMQELQTMPRAVEVRIWLADANEVDTVSTTYNTGGSIPDSSHMYSQTVDLPLSQNSSASSAGSQADTSSIDDDSSAESENGSGETNAFGN